MKNPETLKPRPPRTSAGNHRTASIALSELRESPRVSVTRLVFIPRLVSNPFATGNIHLRYRWVGRRIGPEKRKARFGSPPGVLEARFFPTFRPWPRLTDIPPEVSSESLWPARWRWAFRGSLIARGNDQRMAENQEMEIVLRSEIRPRGPKTGRSALRSRFSGRVGAVHGAIRRP